MGSAIQELADAYSTGVQGSEYEHLTTALAVPKEKSDTGTVTTTMLNCCHHYSESSHIPFKVQPTLPPTHKMPTHRSTSCHHSYFITVDRGLRISAGQGG